MSAAPWRLDGTVFRILDRGEEGERQWRALVMDSKRRTTVHVTLPTDPGVGAGDKLSFDATLTANLEVLHEGDIRLELPPQVTLDTSDARARLEIMSCAQTAHLTFSDGTSVTREALASVGTAERPTTTVRPALGNWNTAVTWAVARFSEPEVARLRGPVVVLDPALDPLTLQVLRDEANRGWPLPARSRLTQAAASPGERTHVVGGDALISKFIDRDDPRKRSWGVVTPSALVENPFDSWQGFTGTQRNGFPVRLMRPETTFALCVAHEFAHSIEAAFGVPPLPPGFPAALSECFADAAALTLFVVDGGDVEEARLYAMARSAGAMTMPGAYSTGPSCHAAIDAAINRLEEGGPLNCASLLTLAAEVAKRNLPPPREDVLRALETLPGSRKESPSVRVRHPDFAARLAEMEFPVRHLLEDARRGVLNGMLPPDVTPAEAARVLVDGWARLGDYARANDLDFVLPRLRSLMREGAARLFDLGGGEASVAILLNAAVNRALPTLSAEHPDDRAVLGPVVASPGPDPSERAWMLPIGERVRLVRDALANPDLDTEALAVMGETAMAGLLDADDRAVLSHEDAATLRFAWACSLSRGHHLLDQHRVSVSFHQR